MRKKAQSPKSLSTRGTVVTFTTVMVDSDTLGVNDIGRLIQQYAPSSVRTPSNPTPSNSNISPATLTESIIRSTKPNYSIPDAAHLLGVSPSFIQTQIKNSKIKRIKAESGKRPKISKDELSKFVKSNFAVIQKYHSKNGNIPRG